MYTPQEVQDKKFPKAVFGGYDMREVDDFLDAVSADYSALYKENAVLKSKMKVLADKLEEYRGVDAAMRKALIVAQKMANEMTEDAKVQSDEIRSKARADYENSIAALKDSIRNEERRLEAIREESKKYVESTVRSFAQQIEFMKSMLTDQPTEPENRKAYSLEDTAAEIERSLQSAFQAEMLHGGDADGIAAIAPAAEAPAAGIAQAPIGEVSGADFDDFTLNAEDNASAGYEEDAAFPVADGKDDSDKIREVNVGGMNIKVYEMELGGEKYNR